MQRSIGLRVVVFVVTRAALILALASVTHAGSINLGSSGSSGSSGSKGKRGDDVPAARREFVVATAKVGVPDESEHLVLKLPSGDWVWAYGGNQVFSGQQRDVFAVQGIAQAAKGNVGPWEYAFGSNGNCVVYAATHKTIPGLHVYGSARSEEAVRLILGKVVVTAVTEVPRKVVQEQERGQEVQAPDPADEE